MPKGKHLKGVGEKEQKMYEHIVDEAKKDHRYGKRAEEVAARTVMKHHREEHPFACVGRLTRRAKRRDGGDVQGHNLGRNVGHDRVRGGRERAARLFGRVCRTRCDLIVDIAA